MGCCAESPQSMVIDSRSWSCMDTQTEKPQLEIEDEAPATTVHGTYFQHVS